MKELEKFKEILKFHRLRITQSRLAVASILIQNRETPFTPEEIFDCIQRSDDLYCDQVSVYRTLSIFEDLGLVSKFLFHGQAARYMISISNKNTPYHKHYFKCDQCHWVEPLGDCILLKTEKRLEKKGYRNLHHHIEVTGLCPRCTT